MSSKVVKSIVVLIFLLVSIATITLADKSLIAKKSLEQHSPNDWVKENQIHVYPNRVILDLKDATWASFANTNSMDPFIDEKSNAIEILPDSANEIQIGDVISYQTNYGVIIHRVIDKSKDSQGIYYIVKGDNNPFTDAIKVRFSDVKGVVVAVIY